MFHTVAEYIFTFGRVPRQPRIISRSAQDSHEPRHNTSRPYWFNAEDKIHAKPYWSKPPNTTNTSKSRIRIICWLTQYSKHNTFWSSIIIICCWLIQSFKQNTAFWSSIVMISWLIHSSRHNKFWSSIRNKFGQIQYNSIDTINPTDPILQTFCTLILQIQFFKPNIICHSSIMKICWLIQSSRQNTRTWSSPVDTHSLTAAVFWICSLS